MTKQEFNTAMGFIVPGFNVDEYRNIQFIQYSTTRPKTVDGDVVPQSPPIVSTKGAGTYTLSSSIYSRSLASLVPVDGVLTLSYASITYKIWVEVGILICEMTSHTSAGRFMAQGYSEQEALYAARVVYYYEHIGTQEEPALIDVRVVKGQDGYRLENRTQMGEREVFLTRCVEDEAYIEIEDGVQVKAYMQTLSIGSGKTFGWGHVGQEVHISRHVKSMIVQCAVGDPATGNWRYQAFRFTPIDWSSIDPVPSLMITKIV